MAEHIEDRLRQAARQAKNAKALQVTVTESSGDQPIWATEAEALADLVAAVREVKRDWDGVVIVDALDGDLLKAMFAALAALDEASRG